MISPSCMIGIGARATKRNRLRVGLIQHLPRIFTDGERSPHGHGVYPQIAQIFADFRAEENELIVSNQKGIHLAQGIFWRGA